MATVAAVRSAPPVVSFFRSAEEVDASGEDEPDARDRHRHGERERDALSDEVADQGGEGRMLRLLLRLAGDHGEDERGTEHDDRLR